MASILFLDDCPTRTDWAVRNLRPDHRWYVEAARDAKEAIRLLAASPFDLVYLDHDLDGEAWADWRGKNTGTEVVRWILLNKPTIGRIVVHSMNSPAGNRMARALTRAGYDAEYRSWLTIVNENRDGTPTTSSPATGPR